jgi:hypothetical protein
MVSMREIMVLLATFVVGCGNSKAPADTADAAIFDTAPADAPPVIRQLGLEVNQPPALDQGAEIDAVKPFGVGVVTLTMPWSVIEPGSAGFDQDSVDLLAFGMSYYAMHGVKVMLSIPAIDTVANLVPSDLATMKLDSPMVIARAEAFVAEVLAQCHGELAYLVLSNEVDINLGDGSPTWSELDALTAAMAAKAHALRPDVKTGISVTASALLAPNADAIAALEANDLAFVTYYSAGNFGAPSTAGVAADIATIVGATTKSVVFKEFGYATGAPVGGSEAGQQAFVQDMFTAWDAHAQHIPLLVFSRMFDGDQAACAQQATDYGFANNAAFISFLCTLGIRTYADAPKAAWTDFTVSASARVFAQ